MIRRGGLAGMAYGWNPALFAGVRSPPLRDLVHVRLRALRGKALR